MSTVEKSQATERRNQLIDYFADGLVMFSVLLAPVLIWLVTDNVPVSFFDPNRGWEFALLDIVFLWVGVFFVFGGVKWILGAVSAHRVGKRRG